ncbi:RabGAP/TBC [Trichoderma reesei RUT C-30]|uniref:RabGAP/TBC n=1 Tax=Hypocrea jecorina (strain ATCC 56765 / BCRC 32924 / NRRL 11460 / Rut C-30) TaxID=1344414 RepID=A0A024SN25_HYPJR|nr:RabGAP/TBC [Trichoderma reesei RUT C-30]
MRSLTETQARWQATQAHCASLDDLRNAVRHNGPSSPCLSGCRSVCWKVFLLSKDGEDTRSGWPQTLRDKRELYNERRDHFLKFINHPEALTELAIDPLADDPKSPWNTVREDEVIRAEILQDVQRLPDEANYHEDYMQRMILDILFIYCKVNPSRGGYRQGMHEVLAPILHVVEQDSLDRTSVPASDAEDSVDELMLEAIDRSFIEHDAFVLFSQLMEHAQSFYEVKDVPDPNPPTDGSSQARFPEQSSAIVERSRFIHEVCLQKVDPELAAHLTSIEILPQIFLIRWIRLLFSREFPFNQFLVLWDTILAVDPSLDLIDLICCAMLLRIRWQLLESDYSVCLQLLLKYPPPDQLHGPQTFVDDALYLRDHMNAAGGAALIKKYSGKVPKTPKSPELAERIGSPSSGLESLRRKGFGLRSPIRSPSKFLQQQGGVENMIQGVLERGEKLGINQALRDAVGEIKRNMQGLNEGLSTPPSRAAMADDGAAKALAVMQRRNEQLASLLEETVLSLRALSLSNLEDKARSLDVIEVAAAKVQFVQIYLQDSTMDIPTINSPTAEETPAAAAKREGKEVKGAPAAGKENQPLSPVSFSTNPSAPGPVEVTSKDLKQEGVLSEVSLNARPAAPIPARSTIAQSSFSWMLEPDESGPPQTPPAGKSPASQQKRRGNNASREKNAFLFGEVPAEVGERDPLGSGDIFGLEPIESTQRSKE